MTAATITKAKYGYLSPLRIPEGQIGKFSVAHEILPAGSRETIVSLRNAIFMGLHPAVRILKQDTICHKLRHEDDGLWMTDHWQEVEQAGRQLGRFRGKVLVGGLGLGLAVSILENNPLVTSITVVERSPEVSRLVFPHLNTKKSQLITDDLYNFIRSTPTRFKPYRTFDYAFYDIWQPTGEMCLTEHVMPLRRLSYEVGIAPMQNIECWNEDEMLGQVRLGLMGVVQIAYDGAPNIEGWDKFNLVSMPDERFQQARRALGWQWPFINWLRIAKPTREKAMEELPRYMDAIKDPANWDNNWKQYDSRLE